MSHAPRCLSDSFLFIPLFPDFNEDDYICENDLKKMITKLCGEQRLTEDSIQNVIDKVCMGVTYEQPTSCIICQFNIMLPDDF